MNSYLEKINDVYTLKYKIDVNDQEAGELWVRFLPNETAYIPVVFHDRYHDYQILETFCKRTHVSYHIESAKNMINVLEILEWNRLEDIIMQGYYRNEDYVDVDFSLKGMVNFQFALCFKEKKLQSFSMLDENAEELIDIMPSALPKWHEIVEYILHSSVYRLRFLMDGF